MFSSCFRRNFDQGLDLKVSYKSKSVSASARASASVSVSVSARKSHVKQKTHFGIQCCHEDSSSAPIYLNLKFVKDCLYMDPISLGLSKCENEIVESQKRVAGFVGAFTPRCIDNGDYEKKQCHGSTGYCWCVEESTGKELLGSRKRPGAGDPQCRESAFYLVFLYLLLL